MILEKIRAETRKNHVKLEENRLLLPFSRQEMDWSSYQKILTRFYGYFQPLEGLVDRLPVIHEFLPDYSTRRKASLLLLDLQRIESQLDELPICRELPEVINANQAFGCLYVMEGSTLGGKYIARVLSNTLGLTTITGAAFFNGYGDQTGRRWQIFQQALVAFSEQQGDPEAIIESANQAFEKFGQWLNQESVQHQ